LKFYEVFNLGLTSDCLKILSKKNMALQSDQGSEEKSSNRGHKTMAVLRLGIVKSLKYKTQNGEEVESRRAPINPPI
jgi:hypothetical protein